MIAKKIAELEKKQDRLDFESHDLEVELEDSRKELKETRSLINKLEAQSVMDIGDAFESKDGILGVVLYRANDLFRVALRLWNGRYVEDWIDPMVFNGKPLENSLSHETYCAFRMAGAV